MGGSRQPSCTRRRAGYAGARPSTSPLRGDVAAVNREIGRPGAEPRIVFPAAEERHTPMQITLKGRKALVTGGSLGLGFAIAKEFAEAGADVAIMARRRGPLDEAAAAIEV